MNNLANNNDNNSNNIENDGNKHQIKSESEGAYCHVVPSAKVVKDYWPDSSTFTGTTIFHDPRRVDRRPTVPHIKALCGAMRQFRTLWVQKLLFLREDPLHLSWSCGKFSMFLEDIHLPLMTLSSRYVSNQWWEIALWKKESVKRLRNNTFRVSFYLVKLGNIKVALFTVVQLKLFLLLRYLYSDHTQHSNAMKLLQLRVPAK